MNQRGNREHEAPVRGDPMRPARHQSAEGRLVPMTYDKPDALEELKAAIATVNTACRMGISSAGMTWGAVAERMGTAIAAWEKERAEFEMRRELLRTGYESVAAHLNALRAAVEKVRDEINLHAAGTASGDDMMEWVDALDAALRGGA